ncbi:hypothetical protein EDD27_1085 [Nonomuraea polychroma]|uniref:Uncharacterized protein n=2 Tax=Nonomuraea polychroma TaxID=46176 RepID=A0A438LZD1_9ACTN|nr:hypothetical protein EDD27_1085 [Nonomuraea polychroma]
MSADGDWKITTHTPRGDFDWFISIVTTGESFTGTLDIVEDKMTLDEGRIDGNELTWTSTMKKPRVLKFTARATVEGDEITGEFKMGMFGNRPFEGRRVGPAEEEPVSA